MVIPDDDQLRDVFYDAYRESVRSGGSYWTAHGAGLLAVATACQTDSRAVVERLQGELDAQTVEWGVRYLNMSSEPVYISHGDEDPRASCEEAMAPGDVLVSRKVGPWLPVPTDGAEN